MELKLKLILFIKNIYKKIKANRKPDIPFLVFWVGTKCTLKCKHCCNLIPYIDQLSSNYKEIIKDLNFIYKNTNIKSLQIQGGEPFTHPDIEKIIDFAGTLKRIPNIEIATNGTVNLSENVIKSLKRNPNAVVRISNYDCTKNKREQFLETLKMNDINYSVYNFLYDNNTWFSTGGINETREENDEIASKTYKDCDDKGCVTYYDGNIYICGKIPAIRYWYKVKKNDNLNEINIRKLRKLKQNKNFKNEVKKFYNNYGNFQEECRYCRISNKKYPGGEQLTSKEIKDITERQQAKEK